LDKSVGRYWVGRVISFSSGFFTIQGTKNFELFTEGAGVIYRLPVN
jgi:hypothetical protein